MGLLSKAANRAPSPYLSKFKTRGCMSAEFENWNEWVVRMWWVPMRRLVKLQITAVHIKGSKTPNIKVFLKKNGNSWWKINKPDSGWLWWPNSLKIDWKQMRWCTSAFGIFSHLDKQKMAKSYLGKLQNYWFHWLRNSENTDGASRLTLSVLRENPPSWFSLSHRPHTFRYCSRLGSSTTQSAAPVLYLQYHPPFLRVLQLFHLLQNLMT